MPIDHERENTLSNNVATGHVTKNIALSKMQTASNKINEMSH